MTTIVSSSSSTQKVYDLFVSYRGPDVKKSFVSHLRDRLEREGFKSFYDDDSDDAGKRIDDKIFSAIRQARVALIVLSTNYAGSKWCLNELVEILECNSEPVNLVVIPVFYEVDPANVKNLRSKSEFGLAFERLCKEKENVQRRTTWEKALQEVKNFSGFELKKFRDHSDLLNTVIDCLYKKIDQAWSLKLSKYAIGADRLAKDVIPLLKIGKKDVRTIGISGSKEIGKTFVARAVCKGTLDKFNRIIFLDKIGEGTDNDRVELQKKLLQSLVNVNRQRLYDSSYGYTERIKKHLHHMKILLVLDGVTETKHTELFGANHRESFCSESRILITTRDRNLLKELKVDDTYNVEGLNRDEAFRLFCLHAFKGEEPKEGFEELSRYLAHYAGGHPKALEKWGSALNNWSKDESQKLSRELMNDPEHINSIIENFWQKFPEYPCKVGGPRGGDPKAKAWKDGGYQGVIKIMGGVDSKGIKFITVQYDENGRPAEAVIHGTKGGQTHTIELDFPGEYLSYMSGHTKEDSGRTILKSLTFHTNRGKRASIGTDEEGRKFSFPYTGHKIVGFHWSCNGSHLESIEAMYKPVPHTPIGYFGGVSGPFGGAGEKSWATNDIKGIFVSYADFINEIDFEGGTKSSKPRTTSSENGEEDTFEVKLEVPSEYITSFSGYFENACDGRILIKSLTFQTNKRILGPIGREEGKHFSSPLLSEAVKVTRFFGRTTDYLESIGAQVKPYYPSKSVWLFGCSNAPNWDDEGDYTNVRKIIVEPDDEKFIQSITFHYEVKNRPLQEKRHPYIPPKYAEPPTIEIDANEYLTSISGYYTECGITSLTFGTNKRVLKCIGRKEGIHFSSPATGGKIIGFYGRSDGNLKAIGAYFERSRHPYPITLIGPFEDSSEETWKYENIEGVREIEVKYLINIHSIKFVYKDGSGPSYLVRGGTAKGNKLEVTKVTLDYPQEYLTSISGYAENGAIQSLTFYSNKRSYDCCGNKKGKYFWYPSNGSRITGFYGTRDPDKRTLTSIGVYVAPVTRMHPFKTVGPFGGSVKTPWDDGVHTDVRGFRISFGKAIMAIGIAYDSNGSFVSAPEHGIGYGDKVSFVFGLKPGKTIKDGYVEVLLDYPEERLLSIWVWVHRDGQTGQPIIQDMKIFTTKTYYGPFISVPREKRNKMMRLRIPSEDDDGRIVGFFGRVGRYLHSIGARLGPY